MLNIKNTISKIFSKELTSVKYDIKSDKLTAPVRLAVAADLHSVFYGEEQAEQPLGQHALHGVPGDQRKGQIHQRDAQRAEHVQQEEGQVGLIIRGEDAQIAAFPHLFRGHEDPPFKCKDVFIF
mgnify:CR=1 FL=1